MEHLLRFVRNRAAGARHTLALRGEPGGGRSTLLAAFARDVMDRRAPRPPPRKRGIRASAARLR